jgi:hypothetical protein
MDLSNARRGLLIDLDLADDLQVVLPEGREQPVFSAMIVSIDYFVSL